MAPSTRNQSARSKAPESAAAAPSPTDTTETKKSSGHIKFGNGDDNEDDNVATSGAPLDSAGASEAGAVADEAEDDSDDSDDDAPEAVTMGSGKEAAQKAEEDAKKAIEAQQEALREKRKRREAILKEQKESADARKRRKTALANPDSEAAEEKDTADKQLLATTTPAPKAPTLLPESLLEKLSDRPSPPPSRTHKRAGDFGANDDSDDDDSEDVFGDSEDESIFGDEISARTRERNQRKRIAKKAKMEFKKGPVNVKVLKDEKKARKILMPPANKKVVNTKDTWLSGRGAVKRRGVGGGIGGAFSKKL